MPYKTYWRRLFISQSGQIDSSWVPQYSETPFANKGPVQRARRVPDATSRGRWRCWTDPGVDARVSLIHHHCTHHRLIVNLETYHLSLSRPHVLPQCPSRVLRNIAGKTVEVAEERRNTSVILAPYRSFLAICEHVLAEIDTDYPRLSNEEPHSEVISRVLRDCDIDISSIVCSLSKLHVSPIFQMHTSEPVLQ